MEQTNIKIGKLGEKIALKYLISHGYVIIAKNARISHKEIDLIVQKGLNISFIEVKTRWESNRNKQIKSEDYLSRQKIRFLKTALDNYCLILAKKQENMSIGLLAITIKNNKMANISYFKNII